MCQIWSKLLQVNNDLFLIYPINKIFTQVLGLRVDVLDAQALRGEPLR